MLEYLAQASRKVSEMLILVVAEGCLSCEVEPRVEEAAWERFEMEVLAVVSW